MRKQFCLMILCVLIFACSAETSSHEESGVPDAPSRDEQTFTQQSRRVMKGGDNIGKMKEVKQYDENDKLQYYVVYDYSKANKEAKLGEVTATIYGDENKQEKIGKIIYKFNNKVVLIEYFDEGKTTASEAEYIEYKDDDFKFHTKYCQYIPSENNKVVRYRIVDFNEGTFDYIRETDYLADGLEWNSKDCKTIGDLKILEENLCYYNAVEIPNTNDKQHQWTREVYRVNEYSKSGEKLSEREYQYDFLWNENVCETTHIQQNSFERDFKEHKVISTNDIVMRSFQTFGNKPEIKRKSWISAECEIKYYYNYEYAAEPNNPSDYYESCEELVEISGGVESVKYKKKYSHYIDENNELIYEETEFLGNEPQRSADIRGFSFSHAPKRYARGR